jgi:predicted ATPase with chaperone activity
MGTTAPLVIASANPCPCGRRGYDTRPNACVCSEKTVEVNNFKIKSYGEILGCPAIVEVA